jgi:hypothetical protein
LFEASHKPVENGHTLTAFLLAVAFVFIPLELIFFGPLSKISLGLAVAASVVCLTAAWVNGKSVLRRRVVPIATVNQGGK